MRRHRHGLLPLALLATIGQAPCLSASQGLRLRNQAESCRPAWLWSALR
jgi:hypothetical protein